MLFSDDIIKIRFLLLCHDALLTLGQCKYGNFILETFEYFPIPRNTVAEATCVNPASFKNVNFCGMSCQMVGTIQ